MAAGAKVQHIKVALHNILRRRVQLAIFNNLTPAHLRIAVHPQGLQALLLQQSRLHYAFADSSGGFTLSFVFSSLNSTLLRFICISILSISGPEILRL